MPSSSSNSGSGSSSTGSSSNSTPTGASNSKNSSVSGNVIASNTGAAAILPIARNAQIVQSASAWAFQLLPELYNHYQKVADIFRRPSLCVQFSPSFPLSLRKSGAHVRTHALFSPIFPKFDRPPIDSRSII